MMVILTLIGMGQDPLLLLYTHLYSTSHRSLFVEQVRKRQQCGAVQKVSLPTFM